MASRASGAVRPLGTCELRERGTTPEAEGVGSEPDPTGGVRLVVGCADQTLEARGVEHILVRKLEDVARRLLADLGRGERPAELRDVTLDRPGGAGHDAVVPELLDDLVERTGPAFVHEQVRGKRPPPSPTQIDRCVGANHFERTENAAPQGMSPCLKTARSVLAGGSSRAGEW